MKISNYTLPEDIESEILSSDLKAFEKGDKKLKEVEKFLSDFLTLEIEDNKQKLLKIFESGFELINYDGNLINDLIQYYLYLKIIEQKEEDKKQEENNKKYEEKQEELLNDLKTKNISDLVYDDLKELSEDTYKKFIKNYIDKEKSQKNFNDFINILGLEKHKFLFLKFLKIKEQEDKKHKEEQDKFYTKFFINYRLSGNIVLIKNLDLNLIKKYEELIFSEKILRNNPNKFKIIEQYILYKEDNKEDNKINIDHFENSDNKRLTLEIFLELYFYINKQNGTDQIKNKTQYILNNFNDIYIQYEKSKISTKKIHTGSISGLRRYTNKLKYDKENKIKYILDKLKEWEKNDTFSLNDNKTKIKNIADYFGITKEELIEKLNEFKEQGYSLSVISASFSRFFNEEKNSGININSNYFSKFLKTKKAN